MGFPDIPGFKIHGILGRGSMATVYRATQVAMNRVVALKVMRKDVMHDKKVVQRMFREAKLAASLNHPHIVRAHDAGIHDGECWFAMECIDGVTLREMIEAKGRVGEPEAVRVAVQVAEALRQFHAHHIVHRDVKPANIIVEASGNALLADLGLAKIETDTTMTSKDRAVGTPQYMSPEQARDPNSVDFRSDIFSLGTTLYHAITGISPFEGQGVGAVLTKLLHDDPPPVRAIDPELSVGIERVLTKMLQKDRDQRYLSPAALLRDLRALERGAEPPNLPKPRRRWLEWTVAATVGGAAVVALATVAFWPGGDRGSNGASPDDSGAKAHRPVDFAALGDVEVADLALKPTGAAEERERAVAVLEARVAAWLESYMTAALRQAEARRPDEAAAAVKDRVGDALRERFGISPGELPKATRDRVFVAQETALAKIDEIVRAGQNGLANVVEAAYDRLTEELRTQSPWLDDEAIEARFLESTPPETANLDARRLARVGDHVRRCIDRVKGARTTALRSRIEGIATARRAGRLKTARALIAEERRAGIDRLDPKLAEDLGREAARIDADEIELRRQLSRLVETVDLVAEDGGRPELGRKRFTAAREALRGGVAALPEDRGEVGAAVAEAELIDQLLAVLDAADSWLELCRGALTSLIGGVEVSLATSDGERFDGVRITGFEGDIVRVVSAERPETGLPLHTVAWSALVVLEPMPKGIVGHRMRLFLDYCDGKFLRVLAGAGDLGLADDFGLFLKRKAERGLAVLEHVETAVEREAHAEWLEILSAYRAGDWPNAKTRLAAMRAKRAWTDSRWYRQTKKSIGEVETEIVERMSIDEVVGCRHAQRRVLDWRKRLIRVEWTFDSQEEVADFVKLPDSGVVADGRFARRVSDVTVVPADVQPLSFIFPVDLDASTFRLDIDWVAGSDAKEPPRLLVISAFGQHVAVWSRLRRVAHLRAVPLHGLETQVDSFDVYGRVCRWSGDLGGHARALLAKLNEPTGLVLEPGRKYEISLVLNRPERLLTFIVDGKVHLHETEVDIRAASDVVSIRESAPWALERLAVEGALRH